MFVDIMTVIDGVSLIITFEGCKSPVVKLMKYPCFAENTRNSFLVLIPPACVEHLYKKLFFFFFLRNNSFEYYSND